MEASGISTQRLSTILLPKSGLRLTNKSASRGAVTCFALWGDVEKVSENLRGKQG
jgi:hypothetical protein